MVWFHHFSGEEQIVRRKGGIFGAGVKYLASLGLCCPLSSNGVHVCKAIRPLRSRPPADSTMDTR